VSDARSFAGTPEAVAEARRFVVDRCADLPKPIVDDLAVMVSELATNCVRHAATDFTVSVDRARRRIRVEVSDKGSGVPSVRRPNPSEVSGRGLQIVEALSDSFGVEATGGAPGKTVWFAIELDGKKASMSVQEHRAGNPGTRASGARALSRRRDPGTARARLGGSAPASGIGRITAFLYRAGVTV